MELRCPDCTKSFNHRGHFNEHLLTHSKIRQHECEICGKSFKRAGHLIDHLKIHKPKEFACHCGKYFTYKSNLTQHQKKHDKTAKSEKRSKKQIEVLCGLCFIKFPMDAIDAHMNSEHNETKIKEVIEKQKRFYNCPFDGCLKKFASQYNLTSHVDAIHFRLKKYQCNKCSKSFGFKSALIRHEKLHVRNLEIKCPLCLASFDKLVNLSTHMSRYHGNNNNTGEELLHKWYGLMEEEIIDIC
eukprot:NODE_546_length_6859_cov_0.302071.p2 type:complete len:242 gc:universal NODE_546_length_6859_cov_0.302071:5078-4353(-)